MEAGAIGGRTKAKQNPVKTSAFQREYKQREFQLQAGAASFNHNREHQPPRFEAYAPECNRWQKLASTHEGPGLFVSTETRRLSA